MPRKTGDGRNVPQFFDEWRLVNVRSVPSFLALALTQQEPERQFLQERIRQLK
jgi:hypothetical protein